MMLFPKGNVLKIRQFTRPGKRLQKTNWKITMLSMGKFTISMAIFNSKLLVYQRVIGNMSMINQTLGLTNSFPKWYLLLQLLGYKIHTQFRSAFPPSSDTIPIHTSLLCCFYVSYLNHMLQNIYSRMCAARKTCKFPYPDAPWCWNIYLHLPPKSLKCMVNIPYMVHVIYNCNSYMSGGHIYSLSGWQTNSWLSPLSRDILCGTPETDTPYSINQGLLWRMSNYFTSCDSGHSILQANWHLIWLVRIYIYIYI